MTRLHTLLLASLMTVGAGAAVAQTAPMASPNTDPAAPSASAPVEQRVVAQTTDPLVQHRQDNAAANAEYKQNKKSAKAAYKQRVKAAKADRKQLKKDSAQEERAAMYGNGGSPTTMPAAGPSTSGAQQLRNAPIDTQKQ